MVDDLWVRDSLVEDAVEAQKASGGLADAQRASDYIIGVLERMDRKSSDKPKGLGKKKDAVANEFERRTGDKLSDKWSRSKNEAPAPRKLVQFDEITRVGRARLRARLRWMRSKPDLRREVESVAPLLHSAKKEVREKAANKLRALLDKSDRLAGHSWMKPAPRKLFL